MTNLFQVDRTSELKSAHDISEENCKFLRWFIQLTDMIVLWISYVTFGGVPLLCLGAMSYLKPTKMEKA